MSETSGSGLGIADLSVHYGDRPAVSAVSLEVAPGEVFALAGPNGSGKSTLIRAVATDLEGTVGEVRAAGRSLGGLRPPERARLVAWMPQEEPPGDNVPLADYVEYGRYAHLARWSASSAEDRAAVATALEEVDLTALAQRGIHELSGGERQRARLARALAQDAPVLLLDEPTAHLDINHQIEILDLARRLTDRKGLATLVVLHDLNLASQYCDSLLLLSAGRPLAAGSPAEVVTEANIRPLPQLRCLFPIRF